MMRKSDLDHGLWVVRTFVEASLGRSTLFPECLFLGEVTGSAWRAGTLH
jgi:hypothetical protein